MEQSGRKLRKRRQRQKPRIERRSISGLLKRDQVREPEGPQDADWTLTPASAARDVDGMEWVQRESGSTREAEARYLLST